MGQKVGQLLFSTIYSFGYNYKNPKRIRASPASLVRQYKRESLPGAGKVFEFIVLKNYKSL